MICLHPFWRFRPCDSLSKIYAEFSKFGICYSCYSVTLGEKFKTFSSFILINLQFHQMLEQCRKKGSKYAHILAIPWPKSYFNPSLSRASLTIHKRLQIAFSVRIYPSLFWLVFLYYQDMQNKVLVKLFTNLW